MGDITVVGTRPPDGRAHEPVQQGGWRVLVLVRGHAEELVQAQLSPDDADALARQLSEYAGICRYEHEAIERRRKEQAVSLTEPADMGGAA